MAQQPSYSSADCRVLRAFDSEEWLLDFHESLAYLRQMGRIERTNGHYTLTTAGENRLHGIGDLPESGLEYEAQQIRRIAQEVRTGLGL